MADKWGEVKKGFEKWFRLFCYVAAIYWFLDFLPRLPDEIGRRVVEAIFRKLGI